MSDKACGGDRRKGGDGGGRHGDRAELFREYPIFSSHHRLRGRHLAPCAGNYNKYKFGFQTYYSISTNYLKIWGGAEQPASGIWSKPKGLAIITRTWNGQASTPGLEGCLSPAGGSIQGQRAGSGVRNDPLSRTKRCSTPSSKKCQSGRGSWTAWSAISTRRLREAVGPIQRAEIPWYILGRAGRDAPGLEDDRGESGRRPWWVSSMVKVPIHPQNHSLHGELGREIQGRAYLRFAHNL